MFTIRGMVERVYYIFGGRAPSRWAVICAGRRSTTYGYPAIHRAIRHGYLEYGGDGRSVHITEKGKEYLGVA